MSPKDGGKMSLSSLPTCLRYIATVEHSCKRIDTAKGGMSLRITCSTTDDASISPALQTHLVLKSSEGHKKTRIAMQV